MYQHILEVKSLTFTGQNNCMQIQHCVAIEEVERCRVFVKKAALQMHGYSTLLGECRALWGERSEAWYRVTAAADAEAATYVKRVYVDYL